MVVAEHTKLHGPLPSHRSALADAGGSFARTAGTSVGADPRMTDVL